jgi:acetyl-CoA decarbonylase/synthase complex subunit delta
MGTMGAAAVGAVAGTMAGNALAGVLPADKDAKAKEAEAAEKEAQELQRKADEAKAKAEAARAAAK